MDFPSRFDVIVIGGGHAGTEAALAAARMGVKTLLLTHNVETLGQMSCNPAIGGIGKSHLVKEIDALGGAMARATDKGGIQFRVLNSRKGPAVRATRAQADRVLYKAAVREILENQANLWIFQQACDDLIVEQDQVKGVITQMGLRFHAENVVLTAGTFLGGLIHIGLQNHSGGRAGDHADRGAGGRTPVAAREGARRGADGGAHRGAADQVFSGPVGCVHPDRLPGEGAALAIFLHEDLEGLARRWHHGHPRAAGQAGAASEHREGDEQMDLAGDFHGCLSPDGCVPSGGVAATALQPSGQLGT